MDLPNQATLGARLRKIRRLQGRTLQDVADRAKITVSLLSKIENDKSQPPVATLTRIARSLGVNVTSLLSDTSEKGTIFVPAEDTKNRLKTDKGYEFFSFASQRAGKLMDIYLFTARKGEVAQQALSHSGEEFVYVLKGSMLYKVGQAQYTLQAGDGLYFDAEDDHDLQPISNEVVYIAVFCDRAQK